MIYEICAIIATLTLVILTIYIIQTLKELQKSLKNVSKTLTDLELEMAVLQVDINKFIRSSTELVQKVNEKILDLDPLFQTVHQAGDALNDFSARSLKKKVPIHPLDEEDEKIDVSDNVLNIIDLAKIGIKLYQQIKKRK
jgi:uncharacterized protein YoxC